MKLILATVILLSATSAWCENRCRVYEYAEMKDMTDIELQKEIDKTSENYLSELKYANNMLALNGKKEADQLYKSAKICDEQNSRLVSIKNKRHPIAPSKRPTYESCVEKAKRVGLSKEDCDRAFNK